MGYEPIVFDDAEPIQIPIKLRGKWYALCEANEVATRNFQSAGMAGLDIDLTSIDMSSPQKIKDSLKQSIKGVDLTKLGSSRAVLVGDCLHDCEVELDKEDNFVKFTSIGKSVGREFVEANISPKVVTELFSKAKEISELDKLPTENPFRSEELSGTRT